MDYTSLPLFSLTQMKMRYLSERQSLLAQNIANVDTPGYKAQDVKTVDFAALVGGMGKLTPTSTGSMPLLPMAPDHFKQINREQTAETHPNGNNVSLDEEMKNMSLTQSDYGDAVTLYHKNIMMFKTALGLGGSATA